MRRKKLGVERRERAFDVLNGCWEFTSSKFLEGFSFIGNKGFFLFHPSTFSLFLRKKKTRPSNFFLGFCKFFSVLLQLFGCSFSPV
jgi:hypothetical protein